MYLIDYFFKKDNTSQKSKKISKSTKNSRLSEKVYLVVNKNTEMPLGIYDTLEKAKTEGQSSTYHNCSILEFTLNSKCNYLTTPVFENK
jgi:hypothetical protein